AADAVFLLEIDDAVLVLDDRAVGGAGCETARIGAVHALILAHEPGERAVVARMFRGLDQGSLISRRRPHGLVSVVEDCLGERQFVPLEAGHFARLTADAGGGIDQFADLLLPLRSRARNRPGVPRNLLDLQRSAHAFSSFTKNPLNSGVN